MDNAVKMIDLLKNPAIFWTLAAFTLIVLMYSGYILMRDYALLAKIKREKNKMEAELSKINAKLEGLLRNRLSNRRKD